MSNMIPQFLNVSQDQLDQLFILAGKDMTLTITGSWNGLIEISLWYRPENVEAMKMKVKEIMKEKQDAK